MGGGISCIAKRYSKANNKYMNSYDNGKPSKYIRYLEKYSFYRWAMRQYLPYNKFKQLNKKIDKLDVNLISENSSDGQILEVDLEYHDELHELHNDYPSPPEKLEINHVMLSKYCTSIANKYDIKTGGVNKLVLNLGNKTKYVLHYKTLQLYLSLGMKLA